MTVKQLIDRLTKLDPNLMIEIQHRDIGADSGCDPEVGQGEDIDGNHIAILWREI